MGEMFFNTEKSRGNVKGQRDNRTLMTRINMIHADYFSVALW